MSVYPVKGKKIVVFGLARSGLAAVSWLLRQGAHPIAIDTDPEKQQQALKLGASITPAEHVFWSDVAAVVQSPGIPLAHSLSQQAVRLNIPVISDCELFRQANPEAILVGVTGTNGKSTTTALIGHILKSAGCEVAIGGNIGIPALSLPQLGAQGIYVLELSSYQLELSNNLDINVVAWLNISEDHLERHGAMDQYIEAKYRIFHHIKHSPRAVIGIDDSYSQDIYHKHCQSSSHVTIPVSCRQRVEVGLWVKDHHLVKMEEGQEIIVAELSQYKCLQGQHNYQNIAVAYGVCLHLGIEPAKILKGIETFPGLAHRQEFVVEIDNVAFINDSKATNADAASKALSIYDNIYWIAGGISKSDGIYNLKPYFPKIREAFLFGTAQQEFAATIGTAIPYQLCHTLDEAVSRAYTSAKESLGKVTILFSPACASFDQFKDFEHRGDVFKQLVYKTSSKIKDAPC